MKKMVIGMLLAGSSIAGAMENVPVSSKLNELEMQAVEIRNMLYPNVEEAQTVNGAVIAHDFMMQLDEIKGEEDFPFKDAYFFMYEQESSEKEKETTELIRRAFTIVISHSFDFHKWKKGEPNLAALAYNHVRANSVSMTHIFTGTTEPVLSHAEIKTKIAALREKLKSKKLPKGWIDE